MVDIAKIQSTEASNKIEGIYTSDERLKALVKDSTRPRTRNEREIAGYRDVLNTIHENHDYIPPKPSIILQLHRDLYKFEGMDIGGRYKTSDNIIEEQDAEGNKSVRFRPMPAWETPEAIEKICQSYDEALNSENIDALIIIPMFVLDFLCVHPFNDGNGRLSRLLTLLLLYRSGYIVGKYISIEKLIEQTKEIYYESLQLSSAGWHENKNDYEPFVKYMLGVIVDVRQHDRAAVDRRHQVRQRPDARQHHRVIKPCPAGAVFTASAFLGCTVPSRKERSIPYENG